MDQQEPSTSEQTSNLSQTLLTDTQQNTQERKFLKRAFGPILPGAMRGSIFALLASAMGTGMFNLPYRIDQIGVIAYLLFVIIGGLFSYLGMYLISRLILNFNVDSYSTMSEKAYGKGFRKVAQFCLIIYPWGIIICYQVIFAKFILQLLADNFGLPFYDGSDGRQTETYSTTGKDYFYQGDIVRICVTASAILANLFFILKKEIGILQKVAIIGVISVIINVVIITFTFFEGFKVFSAETGEIDYDYGGITSIPWGSLKWFELDSWDAASRQLQGLASLVFCYVNHQLVFPLVFDLKNPTKKRLDKIFNRVHITEIISYFLVGLAGYLLLAQHIEQRPINAIVMASIKTWVMSVGKCFMVITLFFAVPLNLFPGREVLYDTLGLERNNKNHLILSLGLAFSSSVIALLFQKVNSYFGLLGGTAGVMMAGAIPTICYVKLIGLNNWKQKLIFVFMTVVSLLGMIGAFLSVIVPT